MPSLEYLQASGAHDVQASDEPHLASLCEEAERVFRTARDVQTYSELPILLVLLQKVADRKNLAAIIKNDL